MRIERTKNSIRNSIWGVFNILVSQLGPFAVRTVLIYQMGSAYAGLSTLFTSILTVLSLAELGFGNAIAFSLYRPIAEDDAEKICALMNLYKKVYRVIGFCVLGIGLILIPFLNLIVNKDVPPDLNVYILYGIYLSNTVVSYFLFAYKNCLITAHQRQDVVSKIGTALSCIMYVIQIFILFTVKNYYLYILVSPVFSVLLNLITAHYATKMYPQYTCRGEVDQETKDSIKKQVIGIMFNKIGGVTRNSFDSIVISSFLGLVAVTQYNNYYFIMNAVVALLNVVNTSISAGVGNSIAVENVDKNYRDFNKFQFLYMWISGWCTVCLVCLYQPAIKLWLGAEYLYPTYNMLLFCFYFFLLKVGDINSIYYNSAGLWWYGKMRYIIEAIMNLTLNFVLGYYLGATGIILATILTIIIFTYWYGSSIVFTHYFGISRFKYFILDNFYYLFVTIVASAASYFVCGFVPMNGSKIVQFGEIVVRGLILCVLPNVIFWILYHRSSKYQDAKLFVKGILARKRFKEQGGTVQR